MGIVDCKLSPRQPDVKPNWNLPKNHLQEMIGPGEADRAIAWNELTAEQKKFQAKKMEIHAAMITRMDAEIGRVMDQLKSMGEFENTLIIFISDNGASAEQIIRGDMHDKNAPAGSAVSYLCLGPVGQPLRTLRLNSINTGITKEAFRRHLSHTGLKVSKTRANCDTTLRISSMSFQQ